MILDDEWGLLPMPQSFSSISVYISNNKTYTNNVDDYLVFGLYAMWLPFCLKSSWRCSISTSSFLLVSLIEVQIWGWRSTPLLDGIGYIVDVTSSTMLSLLPSHRWRIMGTIQLKLKWENANKLLADEKYESLLLNAFRFFSHVWERFEIWNQVSTMFVP